MVGIQQQASGEWTYEGGRKLRQVVTDGNRTRYPDGLYIGTVSEWAIFRQFGWYRRIFQVLSHEWDRTFSFALKAAEGKSIYRQLDESRQDWQ